MLKNKTHISLILILILAFLSLNLAFPQYINKGINYINNFQFQISNFKLRIPNFPEIFFKLGLDLQGGSRLVYEADIENIDKTERSEAMQGLRDVIERRVNLFGVGEPMVMTEEVGGQHRLVVELPGVKDVREAIEMLGKTPYLEFQEEREEEEREEILEKQKEFQEETQKEVFQETTTGEGATREETTATGEIATTADETIEEFINPSFKPTKLTGKYLKRATLAFNQTTPEPQVLLEFNSEGADLFKEITSRNVGKRVAIYIDGVLISAPVVREVIPNGRAQITGSFTIEEAKELARNLNAGALPVPIQLISQTTIGPSLGSISLQKSLRAGIVGFLAVSLFIIGFYRISGVLATFALLIYAGILLSLFKLVPVTLTLAGIGGVILSIGMAVDANVLVFERMKEERKEGRSFQRSIEIGFSRAWPSIRDSNVTTLIVAAIMFSFGTSFVKGFALTLSLGVLVSMFSAIFVTKTFLKMLIGTKLEKVKWLWR